MRNERNSVSGCSGRFVLALRKEGRRALLLVSLFPGVAFPQGSAEKSAAKRTTAHRANELTLAGLEPGHDSVLKLRRLSTHFDETSKAGELAWDDRCQKTSINISYDQNQKIQTIQVSRMPGSIDASCFGKQKTWETGHGLRIGDPAAKLEALYGAPDSKSPSTRNGQPLELWYYAFDWAGENVPQVMEVLCTREADGKPGRVIEITLAAPSL
jgi:hypothetical protein